MNIDVTVIICCFNSAKRLPKTLKHLAGQNTQGVNWEIVLVDNKSTDDTIEVAYNEWCRLNSSISLFIVKENTAGLTFARKKGIEASSGDVIVFCDDDNWLDSNYINHIFEIFQNTSYRIVGGWGIPVSDIPFPNWFNQFEGYGYAVGKQGRKTGKGYIVHGAGMSVRRSDGLAILNERFTPLLSDRKGNKLSTGGDAEISILIGHDNRYFDEALIYHHYLPANRLSWEYFISLNYFTGVADSYLYFYKIARDHPSLAHKKYIYRIFSSGISLLLLSKRNYLSNPSLEDQIKFTYAKGYVLQIILNFFSFNKYHKQAKGNVQVFNSK
jgi:glycosyltransferase involved in cell wall biosynthesis